MITNRCAKFIKTVGSKERGGEKADKLIVFEKNRDRKNTGDKSFNWRDQNSRDQREREKAYETPRTLKCYECDSTEHLRPGCSKLKRKFDAKISHIVTQGYLSVSFELYVMKGRVN
ncbi:hypothetical protein AVEN_89621-1 [Araneus ventricosus]|uniref:Uncharacterized protein n=1 Tax=Araneus ventricosus TaxID=182803 RepID=A0A4Y2NHL8_ARAVE|nr:hypothetical protein AVEN_89621-1 [Araneus ventricosus]